MYVYYHNNDERFICLSYENIPLTYLLTYKSLASGALILEIIVIADNKPKDFCYRGYK